MKPGRTQFKQSENNTIEKLCSDRLKQQNYKKNTSLLHIMH